MDKNNDRIVDMFAWIKVTGVAGIPVAIDDVRVALPIVESRRGTQWINVFTDTDSLCRLVAPSFVGSAKRGVVACSLAGNRVNLCFNLSASRHQKRRLMSC